jgi:hypothetical protein
MAEKKMLNLDERFKATVVSILPMKLYESKPGVLSASLPARIPKADFEKREVISYYVADGVRFQYVPGYEDEKDPRSTVTHNVPALQIATAICDDYISSKMGFTTAEDGDDFRPIPGLMPLDGVFTPEEIKTKHADKLKTLFDQQIKWFDILVRLADEDWQRFRSHKMITDEQRIAAKCLKIERDWSIDASKAGFVKCPVCRQSIDSEAIVCSYCNVIIKPETYKKFQFTNSPKSI